MPDSHVLGGTTLHLNGLGLRTYSILGIRIYVAGLYLEQQTSDAEAILHSDKPRMLEFVFLRDVDAERAQKSWRESLERNCRGTCGVPAESVNRFLAEVPAFHKGDTSTMLFMPGELDISINGRTVGRINDPKFSNLVLTSFLGPTPSSERLKLGLLGQSP